VAAAAAGLPPEREARRIRLHFESLGPQYSCFNLYLASRLDVLPAEFCRELALTPDVAAPLSAEEIQKVLARGYGASFQQVFAEFDFVPFEAGLISQSHHALLRTGAPVTAVVLRPWCWALNEPSDTSSLPDAKIVKDCCGDWVADDLLNNFAAALRRKTDLTLAREAIELMARDASSLEQLYSRKTYPELCTPGLLVFESQEEQRLDQLLQKRVQSTGTLAQLLCHVWLCQALHGHCFPVDPQLHNVFLRDEKQISFLHCDMAGLPPGVRENLQNYFAALLADDPDRAAMYLLREMSPSKGGKIDPDSFRSSFRQAAYFGMLEPVLGADSNALAQLVFQHWKTAQEHGYSPKPHLLCFYRGLFCMARLARTTSPSGDPLRAGMDELRSFNAFGQLREIMDWRYWLKNSDKFASALVQLPHTFDDALTRVSGPQSSAFPEQAPFPSRERRAAPVAIMVVLLMLIIVISKLSHSQAWPEKIIALALMLTGVLVLRGSEH